MELSQASNINKEQMLKATPTRNLQQKVRVEIPFRMFHQGSPWAPDQYMSLGSPSSKRRGSKHYTRSPKTQSKGEVSIPQKCPRIPIYLTTKLTKASEGVSGPPVQTSSAGKWKEASFSIEGASTSGSYYDFSFPHINNTHAWLEIHKLFLLY